MTEPLSYLPDSKKDSELFSHVLDPEKEGWEKYVKSFIRSSLLIFSSAYIFVGRKKGWDTWESWALHLAAIILLLFCLYYLEALEIAYTTLRDRNRDVFPDAVKDLMSRVKEKETFVYSAREWLVTLIVVAISFLLEFDAKYFFRWPIASESIQRVWHGLLPIITALPILWVAQGPAKKWASDRDGAPQVLARLSTKAAWFAVAMAGAVIDALHLNWPEEQIIRINKWLERTKNVPPVQLRPSDEAFFLSGLQRYGLAIHKIEVHIKIGTNECQIRQKIVWFVLRYTGKEFSRRLYLEGSPIQPVKPKILSCHCPTITSTDEYNRYSGLLDRFSAKSSDVQGLLKGDRRSAGFELLDVEACEGVVERSEKDGKYSSLRITAVTDQNYPADSTKHAFVLCMEHESHWDKAAFKTSPGGSDSFEMSFEYPCRRYELTIETDPSIGLVQIQPFAEFMGKDHMDETNRMSATLKEHLDSPDHTRFTRTLDYALPGANYRYKWKVWERENLALNGNSRHDEESK